MAVKQAASKRHLLPAGRSAARLGVSAESTLRNAKGARVRTGKGDWQHTFFCGSKLSDGIKCSARSPCQDCQALQAGLRDAGVCPCASSLHEVFVRSFVNDATGMEAMRLPLELLRLRLQAGGAAPWPQRGTRAKIVSAMAAHHTPFVGMEGEVTDFMLGKDLQGQRLDKEATFQYAATDRTCLTLEAPRC